MDPERLAELPLFAELDETERAEIAACTREVTVPAGTTVAEQGDNAYEFFVIEAGEAEARMPAIAETLRATMRERVARTSF